MIGYGIGFVFCVVNVTLALVDSNWHSALGWGCALLYAGVLIGEEVCKSK